MFARFGREVAISGDTMMVGASRHFGTGPEDGIVHFYVRSNDQWTLQQALNPPAAQLGTRFGSGVAIDGDRALIGAEFDRDLGVGSGAAYVYERSGSTWSQTAKLFDATPGDNFNFGSQVALDGDYALVAGRDFDFSSPSNEVHAFSVQNGAWQFDQVFQYSGPQSDPNNPGLVPFGERISIDGDRVAILASFDVQIFTRIGTTWSPQQSVSLGSVAPFSILHDVALDGGTLVTSFRADSTTGAAAAIFGLTPSGWALETLLQPSGLSSDLIYGGGVAVEGSCVAIGSRGLGNPAQAGEINVFENVLGEWKETLVARETEGLENVSFSSVLALSDGQLVVGAPHVAPGLRGDVYTFDLNERPTSFCESRGGDNNGCGACPCGNDGAADTTGGCLNAAGTSATLTVSGAPSLSNDTLRLELNGGNPLTFAILISGAQKAPNSTLNPCFGTGAGITFNALSGLRCVVQDVRRQGTRAIDAQGAVGETNPGWGGEDGPAEGLIAQAGLVAGQTRHFQAFYRETPTAGCMRDQNTSQGISIVVRP